QVFVALGNIALRNLLGLPKVKGASVRDFHGLPVIDPRTGKLVVGTFHPSFLQRGATNLIGTVLWDLQQAERASREGVPPATHTSLHRRPAAGLVPGGGRSSLPRPPARPSRVPDLLRHRDARQSARPGRRRTHGRGSELSDPARERHLSSG